jgi:hypothetical protein
MSSCGILSLNVGSRAPPQAGWVGGRRAGALSSSSSQFARIEMVSGSGPCNERSDPSTRLPSLPSNRRMTGPMSGPSRVVSFLGSDMDGIPTRCRPPGRRPRSDLQRGSKPRGNPSRPPAWTTGPRQNPPSVWQEIPPLVEQGQKRRPRHGTDHGFPVRSGISTTLDATTRIHVIVSRLHASRVVLPPRNTQLRACGFSQLGFRVS